jgi:D-aminoacyl-tRNA deacylase
MRACVQRVSEARVTVAGEIVGQIGRGLVVLLGVAADDSSDDVSYLADKIAELRIFPDEAGKMNRALQEVGGEMLVISQFTLLGDCRKGRRPSFIDAAEPRIGELLYKEFVTLIAARGIEVATGRFRQHMDVTLTNYGPVTLLLDSKKTF